MMVRHLLRCLRFYPASPRFRRLRMQERCNRRSRTPVLSQVPANNQPAKAAIAQAANAAEDKSCPKRESRDSLVVAPAWLRPSVILGSDRALE